MSGVKTVLIGLGKMGSTYAHDPKTKLYYDYISHAQVLKDHPDFDCIAAIDPQAAELADEAAFWDISVVVSSLDALDAAPELAVIATPPAGRLETIKALPDSVKAIILEKPVSDSLEDTRAIIEHCRDRKIALEVNYWRRFDAVLAQWAQDMPQKIGALQTGFAVYGGGLLNNGSHVVDAVRYLCGEVESIQPVGTSESFVIHLKTGANVYASALDFDQYREISIDLWGTQGRFELLQESLNIRHSIAQDHRALTGGFLEVDNLEPQIYKTGAGRALYDLYTHMHDVMCKGASARSSGENALVNETLLHGLMSES